MRVIWKPHGGGAPAIQRRVLSKGRDKQYDCAGVSTGSPRCDSRRTQPLCYLLRICVEGIWIMTNCISEMTLMESNPNPQTEILISLSLNSCWCRYTECIVIIDFFTAFQCNVPKSTRWRALALDPRMHSGVSSNPAWANHMIEFLTQNVWYFGILTGRVTSALAILHFRFTYVCS